MAKRMYSRQKIILFIRPDSFIGNYKKNNNHLTSPRISDFQEFLQGTICEEEGKGKREKGRERGGRKRG